MKLFYETNETKRFQNSFNGLQIYINYLERLKPMKPKILVSNILVIEESPLK